MNRLYKGYHISLLSLLMSALFFAGCEEKPVTTEQNSKIKFIETGESTFITPNGARISGKISASDNIACGIIYDTQSSPSNGEGRKMSLHTNTDFTVDLAMLQPGTTYYYRAYATENGEYQYGEVRSFTTPSLMEAGQAIDLGLSIRWASCNIGASGPMEEGYYYAWGEANVKYESWWESYKWCKGDEYSMTKYCVDSQYGNVDGRTKLELIDDAAYVLWGKGWRMPTKSECQELLDKCTWELVDLSSIGMGNDRYYIITGPNGNYIMLPFEDHWTSESGGQDYASMLDIKSDWNRWVGGHYRCEKKQVRPVCYGSWIESAEDNASGDNNEDTENNEDNNENGEDMPETPESNGTIYTVNGVSFKMISIESGTFTMGATNEQGSDAEANEFPTHQVTLNDYTIGETEVTQELWLAVMDNNPSSSTNDMQYPVDVVSWDDCLIFINKLNELTGENFRLPSEAEWEYAARGGNQSRGYKYSGSNTIDDVAWYNSNSIYQLNPVKTKQPNELGIYDMSGNVCEWCIDAYSEYPSSDQTNPVILDGLQNHQQRVLRGGYCDWSSNCRTTHRDYYNRGGRFQQSGFRLAQGSSEEPDADPRAIDLGLSVKWASCNIGANSPEEHGGYYAWGETEEKESYSTNNYQYYDAETRESTYIGSDISGTDYDVAHVKWGNNWRMPTRHEIDELNYNCVRVETTINGVSGTKVIGHSGKAIFLPYTGLDASGEYWSSTMLIFDDYENWYGMAYTIHLKRGEFLRTHNRHSGLSVRPVKD